MQGELTAVVGVGVALLYALGSWAAEPAGEVYVVNRKPASIAVVDTGSWQTRRTIQIPEDPTQAVLSLDGRHLYVLHHGMVNPAKPPKSQAELSIVDLQAGKVLQTTAVGFRVTNYLAFSPDRRFLVIGSDGVPGKGSGLASSGLPPGIVVTKRFRIVPSSGAMFTLVDRANDHAVTVIPVNSPASIATTTRDGSRLFVLTVPEEVDALRRAAPYASFYEKQLGALHAKPGREKSSLSIYRPGALARPEHVVELDCWPASFATSVDGQWAYLLDPGFPSPKAERHQDGSLVVVDIEAGKVAAVHRAGAGPHNLFADEITGEISALTRLTANKGDSRARVLRFRGAEALPAIDIGDARYVIRLPGVAGRWLVTGSGMYSWPDGGAPGNCIPLAPRNGSENGGKSSDGAGLDATPDGFLALDGERLAVRAGEKVGIVSLKAGKLEHVVSTGRGAVKFGKVFGAVMLGAAISGAVGAMLPPGQIAATPGADAFFSGPAAYGMLTSPGGESLYVLNGFSDDVTIIDTRSGRAVAKVGVGGGCHGIGLAGKGRYVVARSEGQVTLIDTENRRKALEYVPQNETVIAVSVLARTPRIVVLTTHSLVVINAESGGVLPASKEKFGDPLGLVELREVQGSQ